MGKKGLKRFNTFRNGRAKIQQSCLLYFSLHLNRHYVQLGLQIEALAVAALRQLEVSELRVASSADTFFDLCFIFFHFLKMLFKFLSTSVTQDQQIWILEFVQDENSFAVFSNKFLS